MAHVSFVPAGALICHCLLQAAELVKLPTATETESPGAGALFGITDEIYNTSVLATYSERKEMVRDFHVPIAAPLTHISLSDGSGSFTKNRGDAPG